MHPQRDRQTRSSSQAGQEVLWVVLGPEWEKQGESKTSPQASAGGATCWPLSGNPKGLVSALPFGKV